jgi:LPS export ABC transporter protein LptC
MSARRPFVIAAAAASLLAACQDDAARPPVATSTVADSADQVMYGVQYVLHDAGVQKGRLYADTAYVFDDNSRFEFRVVRVEFNSATGTKNGTMTADRGRYDIRRGLLVGYGRPARVVTTDGKTLTSNHLEYNQTTNQISSDSAFTLVDGERVSEGVGFRTDPNLTRIQVLSGARGRAGQVVLPGQ